MLFHSLVFLLAFLPLTLGAHYLLGERYESRVWVRIIASLGFCGYWGLRFLPLLVVPYHLGLQPQPGSRAVIRYRECRRRLANLAVSVPNSLILGFMIPSKITSRNENDCDNRHGTRWRPYRRFCRHRARGMLWRPQPVRDRAARPTADRDAADRDAAGMSPGGCRVPARIGGGVLAAAPGRPRPGLNHSPFM